MTKSGNKFVNHHAGVLNRKYPTIEEQIEKNKLPPLCACGCGGEVTWNKKKKCWNISLRGHTKGYHHTEESLQLIREARALQVFSEEAKVKIGLAHTGKIISEETKKKNSKASLKMWENPEFKEAHSGENCHLWQGGISYLPYSSDWSKELKEQIRERDEYICQICLIPQNKFKNKYHKKLSIHHIDYNKKNCNPDNLVSLCTPCHSKTNTNRKGWVEYFSYPLNKREIK
jgi:hypothetical protein